MQRPKLICFSFCSPSRCQKLVVFMGQRQQQEKFQVKQVVACWALRVASPVGDSSAPPPPALTVGSSPVVCGARLLFAYASTGHATGQQVIAGRQGS